MNEYLFLFRGGDGSSLKKSSEAWQAHMQKWMLWMSDLAEKKDHFSLGREADKKKPQFFFPQRGKFCLY